MKTDNSITEREYDQIKKAMPDIFKAVLDHYGDSFIPLSGPSLRQNAYDLAYQLNLVRRFQGPLEKDQSLWYQQLREFVKVSDGILAARMFLNRQSPPEPQK
jgi:hypothetical protein